MVKRKTIDAPRSWGVVDCNGQLGRDAYRFYSWAMTDAHAAGWQIVRVRVIREKDYRMLLKEAGRK